MSSNLFFVEIELVNKGTQWVIPSVLFNEPVYFEKAAVKSALKRAKELCYEWTQLAENKVRYYPILKSENRMIDGVELHLSRASMNRIGNTSGVAVIKIFNLREKLAPDKVHRLYIGECLLGGEVVDVYTGVRTEPIGRILPISNRRYEWREGAFFRTVDEMNSSYPAETFRRDSNSDESGIFEAEIQSISDNTRDWLRTVRQVQYHDDAIYTRASNTRTGST